MRLKQSKQSRQIKRTSRLPPSSKKNIQLKFYLPTYHIKNSQLVKKIQTYNSYSQQQLKKILDSFIDKKKFKSLVCDALKLEYLYYPIIKTLSQDDQYISSYMGTQYKVHEIMSVIIENKFYRNISQENQFQLMENHKSTLINLRCMIAGLLTYSSSKLNMMQIQHTLKIFRFQQKLNQTYPYGISLENQKILKIIKKLQRSIKPIDFKIWVEDFKNITNSQTIQNYQFLYLLNLSQRKIQQDNYMFMTTKKNLQQMLQNQGNLSQKQNIHVKILQNGVNNDEKFKIKSFSYKQKRQNLPIVKKFTQIKQNLSKTTSQLFKRKKALTISGRINNLHQLQQNLSLCTKNKSVKFQQKNPYLMARILKQNTKGNRKLTLNNKKKDIININNDLKKISSKFFEISDRKIDDINQMMERVQNCLGFNI